MLELLGPSGSATAEAAGEDAPAADLENLMARYQDGDGDAFEELYDRLLPALRSYLIHLARNVALAEDLLQETFLRIHRSRQTYRPSRPVKPWAFGIARYVYLMDQRASRRSERAIDPHSELPEDLPVPAAALRLADRQAVCRALAELPGEQREPVLLHHVWGFSFLEIARTLGIRTGTAKVRAHRGMKRLRELLTGRRIARTEPSAPQPEEGS